MVLPNDDIETRLHHTGMASGRKIIKAGAAGKGALGVVFVGGVEVEHPVSGGLG